MSAINDALSQLANEQSKRMTEISRADVKPVKQRAILPWVVGSFTLSLAVGGWALSQQKTPSEPTYESAPSVSQQSTLASPTTKVAVVEQPVYQAVSEEHLSPAPKTASPVLVAEPPKPALKPVLTAKVNQKIDDAPPVAAPANKGEVIIEQVELTPQQLSDNAEARAKKALDSNNLAQALSSYDEALRFMPSNKQVRKRLAALYYGKGEVRKAAEILQKGIVLDSKDAELRLSLAKMAMKEQQNSVALTALSALPESASIEYLSLRAALAQKEKQDELALQSYLQLVELDPDSGRWWMGLGIQQERAFELDRAKASYTQALTKLGLSSQSQQFIRDRISLLKSLEEPSNEN